MLTWLNPVLPSQIGMHWANISTHNGEAEYKASESVSAVWIP